MTALPAACSAKLCFTSVFLPPDLSICRARGVSILPPHHSWHLSPAWWSNSRWPMSLGTTTYCLGWARTQPVSWKSSLFSQFFNSDLPNWQPLDNPGPGLLYVRRFSFTFLSKCLHFKRLLAQSGKTRAG